MHAIGSIVELGVEKRHGEGDFAVSIPAGICGMIMNQRRDGNTIYYVTDFGAEGQWNVASNEIATDDPEEGWDTDIESTPQENESISEEDARRILSREEVHSVPSFSERQGIKKKIDADADIKRRVAEIERKRKSENDKALF